MKARSGSGFLPIIIALLLCLCFAPGGEKPQAQSTFGSLSRTGQPKPAAAWVNTDVDGAVTEDLTARIQDDFNLAVNKENILKMKIPAGKFQNGGFYEVREVAEKLRVEAMKDESMTGHDAQLVRKYYSMLSDWETRDKNGAEPALKYVKEVQDISSLREMTAYFSDKERGGLFSFVFPSGSGGGCGCLFSYSVMVSNDDPTSRVLSIDPIGLSLLDAAEYRDMTENGRIKKEANTAVRKILLSKLGFSEQEAERMISSTFELESILAEHMLSVDELNDPANVGKTWNPMDLNGVMEAAGSFPAGSILKGWGLSEDLVFNVSEPDYMRSLSSVYTEENLEMIRDFMIVKMTDEWSGLLDRSTRDETTAADNRIRGIEGVMEDDLQAMHQTYDHLSVPLDNMYIRKYCTQDLRDEVTVIINEIVRGYHRMLEDETWLTEETRKKAIEKLDALTIRAVYPDDLEEWDDLEFKDTEEGGCLLDATLTIDRYIRGRVLSLLDKKVDKRAWDRYEFPASEPNAFYSSNDNSINIPAGILNGPFYKSDYSYEEKLGTIGVVIGHEISHAFDPNGSQYDKDGALNSWWTVSDKKAFDERAQKLIRYYDSIEPLEGIPYSGKLVQTEAVADMGGMKAALMLASEKDDFDYETFFLAYSRLWAVKRLRSDEVNKIKTDVHPLAYLRTNVTVMQFDEFIKQFDVRPGDGMYMPSDERICIW